MSLFDIIINIFEVLPRDIERSTQNTYIQAVLITGFFYFISRWFKAYVLRLGLFLFGSLVVFQVFQGQSFLNRFDFYAGLGILLPHIEIVKLTYLILREKVLHIYYTTLAFLEVIARPFVWLYAKVSYFKEPNKAKQEDNNFKEDFEHRQWEEYQKEQAHNDEKTKREQQSQQEQYKQHKEDERERQTRDYQRKQKEQEKKKAQEAHPRWDNSDSYIILDISITASEEEIKKKYRTLARLYHPDKEENLKEQEKKQEIFKKINGAYEEIMKKFK